MPTLTLNFESEIFVPANEFPWQKPPPGGGAPVAGAWAPWITWETEDHLWRIFDSRGVYVIEHQELPVYAGKAQSFLNRFTVRSNALHNFALRAETLDEFTVRVATFTSAPANYLHALDLAERWLIRYLYVRDFNPGPHKLQNVSDIGSFTAPPTGLSIRYDKTVAPLYFHDAHAEQMPGWAPPAGNIVGFDYAPNAQVLP